MKRKIIAILLSFAVVLSFAGCNKGKGKSESGDIEFWSTYATEKILQDKTDLYDGVKLNAEINADACKGEYESAQLIMTANKAVKAYDAEITDLVGPDGATFPKSAISLRVQKYIKVGTVLSGYNNPPAGMYPDALLPLETAVEYKENSIAAGENQGLYITFNVPADQKAGAYTGSLKVKYDGKEKAVPVNLKVYDVTVSEETRSKSYFNLGFSQHLGDADSTQSMWRTYAEALLEYRISPSIVMRNYSATEDGMREYVDEVWNLVENHGMSTINSPWKNGADLTAFLVQLAKKSVQKERNLLDMTIVKGPDEPSVSALGTVTTFTQSFNTGVKNAIARFDELDASDEFIDELKASAENIPLIIALQYDRSEATNAAGVDTYCPLYDKYDTEAGRAQYDDQYKGRWWYGCVNPRPPYPTYHTEDTLVSARSVGWMMSEYDVIGNLYWATTVYAYYNGESYQPIEDYYDGSATRFYTCNGDGYLFYPGTPYGLSKPVGSLRLEAIRDGNEEYELWYDLKEAYTQAGESADAIQHGISELIYSGTKVHYENISARFASARKAMIQLALLANSPANVLITDVTDDNRGTVTFTVSSKKGYTVKNDGQTLSGTDNGDRTVYTVTVRRDKAVNALALSAETQDAVYSFELDLGGKVDYRAASELLNDDNSFASGNAAVTAEREGERIKLTVGAVKGKHQNIRYNSAVLGSIGAADKKLVLFINNPSDTEITFRILIKQSGSALNNELFSGKLAPCEDNVLEIDLTAVNIANNGTIDFADFYFASAAGDHDEKTVYITGLAIYGA